MPRAMGVGKNAQMRRKERKKGIKRETDERGVMGVKGRRGEGGEDPEEGEGGRGNTYRGRGWRGSQALGIYIPKGDTWEGEMENRDGVEEKRGEERGMEKRRESERKENPVTA